MKMRRANRALTVAFVSAILLQSAMAAQSAAHPVADWIKSAVIYEVNPRTFSATGDFRGMEQRLDYLRDLGVTMVWIMPIHPVGFPNLSQGPLTQTTQPCRSRETPSRFRRSGCFLISLVRAGLTQQLLP